MAGGMGYQNHLNNAQVLSGHDMIAAHQGRAVKKLKNKEEFVLNIPSTGSIVFEDDQILINSPA